MERQTKPVFEFGSFRLDVEEHQLLSAGTIVLLPPRAMDALIVLVQHPGKLMKREELMRAVWANVFVEDANLTVAISHLRKALGQSGESADYIETIPRVGYRFKAEVRVVIEEPAPLIIEKRTLSQTVIEEELVHDAPQSTQETVSIKAEQSGTTPALFLTPQTWILATIIVLSTLSLSAIVYFRRFERGPSPISERTPVTSIKSIAVLPIKPLSDSAENETLSLGMTDALIARIGGIRRIAVRPASAVFRYVGNNEDPIATGKALGVDSILDGSLQRDKGRVRVTFRLLRVADGTQLWAGNFDEGETEIFKLQDSISQQVADALSLNLSDNEKTSLTKQQTANPEAYALYLRGNYLWSKRGAQAGKSMDYLRQAIALDPNFAQAYVVLASANATISGSSPEADALIERALQLDNTSAEAHATYGFIRMFLHWDWKGAGNAFDRALELNPNCSIAHHWRGVYLSIRGRLDEAKAEMLRALELDPLSLIIMADIGQLYYFAHEYDQAIDYCLRALTLDSGFEIARRYLVDIYLMKGMNREALNELLLLESPGSRDQELTRVRPSSARSDFQNFVRTTLPDHIRAIAERPDGAGAYIARRYAYISDFEQTLYWLDRASNQRGFALPYISVDPLFDPLREDRRFQEILRRAGLSPRASAKN